MYYHFTTIGEYQVSVDSHGVTITPLNKYAQKLKGKSEAATYFYSEITSVELIKPNLIHQGRLTLKTATSESRYKALGSDRTVQFKKKELDKAINCMNDIKSKLK